LAIGVCFGVVLGSVLDGPRLFVRRLTQASQRVELRPSGAGLETEPLTAFLELQRERPASSPRPARSAPPPAPPPVAAAPRRPAPEPATPPDAAERVISEIAARDAASQRKAAERVISEIAARDAAKKPSGPQKVVQVAAHTDRQMAEALVRRLQDRGFDSYISGTRPKGKHRYRVRVRPEAGASVKRLASRLEAQGFGVWITTE
jgi:cell division protein FtsN